MQFGLTLPNFQYGAPATREHLLDVAQVAEECGYTSMWTSDHILVGADFPRYGTIFECLTTLAWLAAKTEHIRVGTSILIAPLRNAILTAKQVATIDNLTGGRFVLGVGLGWNEGEFHFLGADWKRRAQIMDESLQVIRNLWTSERPTFAGDFYQYENTLFFPKPAQPGGPPIWSAAGRRPRSSGPRASATAGTATRSCRTILPPPRALFRLWPSPRGARSPGPCDSPSISSTPPVRHAPRRH